MRVDLREKIHTIRERLLDPFRTDGLEEEFEELYELMRRANPEELRGVMEDFEEVRKLLFRNLSIIAGGLKPILERNQGVLFSRRV